MTAGRVVLGLVLVGAGTLALLHRADVIDVGDLVGTFWPLALVVLGLWQLAYDRRSVIGAGLLVVSGLVLLVFTIGDVRSEVLRVAWPIAIVVLGLWVLLGRPAPRPPGQGRGHAALFTLLGSRRETITGPAFHGGAATVVAGHGVLDVSAAPPGADGADLSATVIGGGLEVVVAPGWDVEISGLPLLGGWDDTTRPVTPGDGPAVRIRALVVLGGIEVKYADRWQ